MMSPTSATWYAGYTISSPSIDGIRISADVGGGGYQATVFLIKGVSAKVGSLNPSSTVNGTATTDSLGFAPKLIFFFANGYAANTPDSGSTQSAYGIMYLGYADANSNTQGSISFFSQDAATAENAFSCYSSTYAIRNHDNTNDADFEVTNFGADDFTMTTRTGTAAINLGYLALGGDDISFDTGTLSTPTDISSTTAYATSTDITPAAVLTFLSGTDSTSIVSDSRANGISIGMASDTSGSLAQYSNGVYIQDGADPTNAGTKNSAANLIELSNGIDTATRQDRAVGSVALNTTDFTITYSTIAGSPSGTARKGFWIAFSD